MAVLFLPKHALALMRLEKEHGYKSALFVKRAGIVITKAFRAATGYDVLGFQIHPREGCLHFHISYATVSQDGQLLHAKGTRGRHGPHFLGPAITGALRLSEMGLLPADKLKLAMKWLAGRREASGGDDPIDWRMSEMLDGLCEQFADSSPTVRQVFDDAERDYVGTFESGEVMPRNILIERVKELEHLCSEQDAAIIRLSAERAPASQSGATQSAGVPAGFYTKSAKTSVPDAEILHSTAPDQPDSAVTVDSPSFLARMQQRLSAAEREAARFEAENGRLIRELDEMRRTRKMEGQQVEAANSAGKSGPSYKSPRLQPAIPSSAPEPDGIDS